jgi:hypothetical protein
MEKFIDQEKTQADLDFLLNRSMQAGCTSFRKDRDSGISSNALIYYCYSGILPSKDKYPRDVSDLSGCNLAFLSLPNHRKTKEARDLLMDYAAHLNAKLPYE